MPLLRKKTFEKASAPEMLRDDEEVFYCAMTNEIFRDYEAFSERMFLCNSMVWTCTMTGKSHLTYAEALESEEHARNSLRDFPKDLKAPILYIASLTKRSSFGYMEEDVFLYAKSRFFVGETIETSFDGVKWKESHILHVLAPTPNQINTETKNGDGNERNFQPPAELYKYEVEHLDADDKDISEIMIVDYHQIRRRKANFNREKCKLFLKQYVEQDPTGLWVIKQSAVDEFGLDKMSFDKISDGLPPQFEMSKRLEAKTAANGKKMRQESLDKFLSPNSNGVKNGNANNNLLERMKQKQEQFQLMKQQEKEEKLAAKQKKKEESLKVASYLKDWYKPKEDLELIDQKKLPVPAPVICKIPDEYFGEMVNILEFTHTFSELLCTNDYFPSGISIDVMEQALTTNEVAGFLMDFIHMFLAAIFAMQEEESREYKSESEHVELKEEKLSTSTSLRKANHYATIAYSWSKEHQGCALKNLPLYSLTTSEILRLHLLSSGANINVVGSRWRYQQRGGYLSTDDPGLYLRLNHPHILKALSVRSVVELPMGDKLKILSCLVDQISTYANVRDVIEEQTERIKQAKINYKLKLQEEKKREQEFIAARLKLKKEEGDSPNYTSELEKLELQAEKKKEENKLKLEELFKASHEGITVMGHDRAFRQYLILKAVPGFFVYSEGQNPGCCLDDVVEQDSSLSSGDKEALLAHIKSIVNEANTSDKENSPSQQLKKLNGSHTLSTATTVDDSLMMCSANPDSCVVHSNNNLSPRWGFFHQVEQLNELIASLNVRGTRESELLQNIKANHDEIEAIIRETPVAYLNAEFANGENRGITARKSKFTRHSKSHLGYSADMNPEEIMHQALLDNILNMEEKIHTGSLGQLQVSDRKLWRRVLRDRRYSELEKTITTRLHSYQNADERRSNTPDSNKNEYRDPVEFVETSDDIDDTIEQSAETKEAISCLAVALAQVGESVFKKHLRKPLGHIGRNGKNDKKAGIMADWRQSLLASTSFCQVLLHYSTLDSCVLWTRAVTSARCRICKRQAESQNLLSCESCGKPHHLHCIKLKSMPTEDWFCRVCRAKIDKQKKAEVVAEVKAKKRPIFRDEEIEEEQSENDDGMDVDEENGDSDAPEDNAMETENLCKTCGSGGETICCEKCTAYYHIECVEPPLRHAPRGPWQCSGCKRNGERRIYERNCCNGHVVQRTAVMNGQRRCAAKALYKIHDFAKRIRQMSESDDSSEEEVINKRSARRDDVRADLPLHNAALHEVLAEIMKDPNAWPFLRPVQKTEVPDYYDVITKPMDFGTIKYKLNMGEYKKDAEFMADAVLVFQNCNTYNHTDDDVYKCGVQVLKHFQKKCRELKLRLPDEMDYNNPAARPSKKIRTK